MARFLALSVMFGMTVWEASPVEACSCVVPSTEQALNTSDLVVVGRVVKAELVSAGLVRVDVAVEQMFKGDSHKSIGVFTRPRGLSCYEYAFQVGERYLIFAIRPAMNDADLMLKDLPAGEYITGACLGTMDLATTQGRDRLRATQQDFEARRPGTNR